MAGHRLLLRGGTLVHEHGTEASDLLVEGELICAIGSRGSLDDSRPDEVLDITGKLLLPGLIDPHVHFHVENPFAQRRQVNDFHKGTIAAAYGGVTTFLDFTTQDYSTKPGGQSLLENIAEREAQASNSVYIDWSTHGSLRRDTPNIFEDIPKLAESGIPTFKAFTTASANRRIDHETMLKLLEAVQDCNGMLMVHCEDDAIINYHTQRLVEAGHLEWIFQPQSRPPEAEHAAIRQLIALIEQVPAPVYVVHVSSPKSVEIIAKARSQGLPIHCETCTHYLLLTEDALRKENGEFYICSPPLRQDRDLALLWRAVADGRIEVVSSDDDARRDQDKQGDLGRFDKVVGGMSGVESRLVMLYSEGVVKGRISLGRLVQVTATNPARLFGLYPQKGTLRPGSDADVVVLHPDIEWVMTADTQHVNSAFCPFEGWPVRGQVQSVLSRGKFVIRDMKLVGVPGHGKRLLRRLDRNVLYWRWSD